MPTPDPSPLHLRRIDETRNMRRFYMLTLQPTLFGEASLVRNWGRIGTCGQMMIETFGEQRTAEDALIRLEMLKRRKGYREPDSTQAG